MPIQELCSCYDLNKRRDTRPRVSDVMHRLISDTAGAVSLQCVPTAVRFRATYKKAGTQKGVCFFGAGNRNRTGTDFTPRDFLTTIAFATLLVCGLDHAFTCSRWSVSGLYTFQGYPWLGSALPLSKVSPNLLTFSIVIPGYLLCSLTDRIFVTNGNTTNFLAASAIVKEFWHVAIKICSFIFFIFHKLPQTHNSLC